MTKILNIGKDLEKENKEESALRTEFVYQKNNMT